MEITSIVIGFNTASSPTLYALGVRAFGRRLSLIFIGVAVSHKIDHHFSQAHSDFAVIARHVDGADHIRYWKLLAILADF